MKKIIILFIAGLFLLTCSPVFAQQAARKSKAAVKKAAVKNAPVSKAVFPAVDIIKSAESYVLIVELPGVSSKNVNLEYIEGEQNYVELTGTKTDVSIKTKGKKITKERFIGKFSRKLNIADRIIKDKISAEFKDNILIVTLPILKYQVKTTIKIK